jgi:hypothetical protein
LVLNQATVSKHVKLVLRPLPGRIIAFGAWSKSTHATDPFYIRIQSRRLSMQKMLLAAAVAVAVLSVRPAPASTSQDPMDSQTLRTISARFGELIELANLHDLNALHAMFWYSPSALLVAKGATPAEGNWAGFWGNNAIDRKLHDIAASGPVVLTPDFARLRVVGLTPELAESYAPLDITVSYAGQAGTPKPFLMIINWIRVANDWKVAAEIILPVPPSPTDK